MNELEATAADLGIAAELAEAEAVAREWLPAGRDGQAIHRVMAEYDRRGAEIERLRDVVDHEANEHAYLLMQVIAVLSHWRDDTGPVPRDRSALRKLVTESGYDGYLLAEELDELAERA
jgi:hypothetical protein